VYDVCGYAGDVVIVRLCSVEPGERIGEEGKDLLQWEIIVDDARKTRRQL
jgi:hypothetical protein